MLSRILAIDVFRLLFAFAFVNSILGAFVKALLGIGPGSFAAIYTDMLCFIIVLFSISALCLRFKRVIKNKLDVVFLLFMLFALFEILWTYYLTGSLFVGAFRYRLYFLAYLLYFPLKYFFGERRDYLQSNMIFIRIIILLAFVWSITEYLLVNLGLVSIGTIQSVFLVSKLGANRSSYGEIVRGFGPLGDVLLSGVFYVIGLAAFFPLMIRKKKYWFLFLGITAVVISLAKTAWLLLLIIFAIMGISSISNKKRFIYFFTLLVASCGLWFLYQNNLTIKGSIDATLIIKLPIYWSSLTSAFNGANVLHWLFGFGYETVEAVRGMTQPELSLTVGNEIFFIALFKQFGVIGLFLYIWLFIAIPIRIFFRDDDLLVKGAALAVVISGLSSLHYNAIFFNGPNILTCFLLAYISIKSETLKGGSC